MKLLSTKISESLGTIQKVEQWIDANELSNQYSRMIDETKFVFKKLKLASERKPCIGFFGESQVGKSYLVGSLLSNKGEKLLVSHHRESEPHDFLERLNPNKQSEATAVVTRFTTDKVNLYDGSKFYIELLTPGELLRCLYEGFYIKRDDSHNKNIDVDFLNTLLDSVAANNGKLVSQHYSEDFRDNYFRVIKRLRELDEDVILGYAENAYEQLSEGKQLSELAIIAAAQLLWPLYEPNTNIFKKLFLLLITWGEPSAAYLSSTILSDMLDAGYLNKFKFTDAQEDRIRIQSDTLNVGGENSVIFTESNTGIDLSLLQILSKEVVLNVVGGYSKLLNSFDGIDFPGVKPVGDKETHFTPKEASDREASYLIEVIKIGKLKQLFSLHMDNRDLSSVLLCIQEGEQNPTQVSKLVSEFVNQNLTWNDTNGSDSLITVMTKTDILISMDADDTLAEDRWNTRFTTHFEDHFDEILRGRRNAGGYNNVFLILNPNAPNYSHDNNLDVYEKTYLQNLNVEKYVFDKKANWNALASEDGGIEYLHSTLLTKFKNRDKTYITGLEKEFVTKLKSLVSDVSKLIPEEDEEKKRQQAELELADLLSALDEYPGDYETLLDEVVSWVPKIEISSLQVDDTGVRRRRETQDKHKIMASQIFDQIEQHVKDKLEDNPQTFQSFDTPALKQFAFRLIKWGRVNGLNKVTEYIQKNALMLENNPEYLCKSVQWLISGLFYNLWADEFEFQSINLTEPLQNYFAADEHYRLWKQEVKKVYDLDVDEENSLDTDSLKPMVTELFNMMTSE